MRTGFIDTKNLPAVEYWKIFGRLITSADAGTALASIGWILFLLDHIPDHIFHTHAITGFVFLAALLAGINGVWIMVRTRNRLGTKVDRNLHVLKICYAVFASLTGILAYFVFPAH